MTKDEVIDVIRDAGFAHLATVEDDQPRVRPMMPYLTEDNRILMAFLGRSRTIPQIKKNPKIELCFVDRKMWYCRVTGTAELTENKDDKEILWNSIPMLKQYFGGVDDPNFHCALITINQIEAMTPHQKEPEMIESLD